MGFFLFENYSQTKAGSKKYPPLTLKKPINFVFKELVEILNKEGFQEIKANDEFYDIYGEKWGYEISIQLALSGFNTILDMSIFGEKKRGRTRKVFKYYYNLIEEKFAS